MMRGFRETVWNRMREMNLTYEDLARQAGVSGVYVSKIMHGKVVPSDEVVCKLAEAMGLDLERLVILAHLEKAPGPVKPVFERLVRRRPEEFMGELGRSDNIEVEQLGRGFVAPVVGMVEAGGWKPAEDGQYPAGAADGYIYTDRKGENLFGVRVTNDSMEPEFREGDILVVNPNLEAKSGDYVIAKLTDENEATFKKLVIHPGEGGRSIIILRPLNPAYQDIVITDPEKVEIVGKVVERKTLF